MNSRAWVLVGLVASWPSAVAATTICLKFDTVDVAGKSYVVQNNVWNDVDNSQCLNVDPSTGSFSLTTANHNLPTNGPPAAYPAIFKGCHWGNCTVNSGMPVQVGAMGTTTTSWSTTQPASGVYDVAYDIWFNSQPTTSGQPDGAELMIWLNFRGSIQPIGSRIASAVPIAGANWDVWFGNIGWNVISYVRTTGTTSVSNLDVRAFTMDGVSRGYINSGWYLIAVEAGFEPWQGGAGLASNSFSVSVSGGGGATPTATRTPTPTNAATATATATRTATATATASASGTLLSQGRPAIASSVESATYPASNAVDGNLGTRWSSTFSDPQWIQVDLGAAATITRVVLTWEAAYAKAYQVQVSNDAANWTTVYSTTTGAGGTETLTVSGVGRYVRIYGTVRATPYGYSLWELQVYGSAGSATATATAPARSTATATGTARPTATATAMATPTPGGISQTTWYAIVNKNSGKCVDARAAVTTNGTAVQQYACNGTNAQKWQFTATDSGYYRLGNLNNGNQVWDVGGTTNDGALIQLWSYGGAANQQWLPVSEGGGFYHLLPRQSGKCLDVPGSSISDGVQLQQWTCNGSAGQSFSLQ